MKLCIPAIAVLCATSFSFGASAEYAKANRRPSSAPYKSRPASPTRRNSVHDQFSGQGYGTAGCGLGSVAFGAKPGPIQIVAATLNGSWGTQTFGITSGTSNCDIPENGSQAAAFIEVNKETVRREAARGQGESIRALAEILECKDEAKFGQEIRGNYARYFDASVDSIETIRRLLGSGACAAG